MLLLLCSILGMICALYLMAFIVIGGMYDLYLTAWYILRDSNPFGIPVPIPYVDLYIKAHVTAGAALIYIFFFFKYVVPS